MKLDQLPVELLITIFNYQTTYREIALVNKRFYEIVCELSDADITLRIDHRFYERFFSRDVMDPQCLQSVQASSRKVSKLELTGIILSFFLDGEERPIFRVVEKFAPYLTIMKFADVFTKESVIVEIFTSTPNVEHLEFKRFKLQEVRTSGDQSVYGQCGSRCEEGEINLKKLKSLAIDSCGNKLVRFFHRLPVRVLTELKVACVEWNDLSVLLNHQTNIKKLELGRECPIKDPVVFHNLELESLKLNGSKINRFPLILSKQTRLKTLIFGDECLVVDQVMNAVGNLLELETLSMHTNLRSHTAFADIRKLKKLKNLSLRCGIIEFEILAHSDNTSMEKLTVNGLAEMSVDMISALAKSAPNLKQLKIIHYNVYTGTNIDAVMRHFNFVEVLNLPIWQQDFEYPVNDYVNQKLRELTVERRDMFNELWLPKLMDFYPNLKKLHLIGGFFNHSVELKPILHGFTKLRSLTLRAFTLNVEDLDYLPDHKHNLEFVSLGRLRTDALTDGRLRKLCDSFGIANVRNGGILDVAVDRCAMNSNAP